MLVFILEHRPAEFGLVPSIDGFVQFKELMKALHEEPGWSYVRQSHIHEVLLGKDRPLFETDHDRIRTRERRWQMDLESPVRQSLPKILFTSVRRKAHPIVMERGLKATPGRHLILSADEAMALRIGRRRDPQPVLLRVEAERARTEGVSFHAFDTLFLCDDIPQRYVSGPPVPKDRPAVRGEKGRERKQETVPTGAFTPGTFLLDPARDPDPGRRGKGRKGKGWKEDARKIRREKRR